MKLSPGDVIPGQPVDLDAMETLAAELLQGSSGANEHGIDPRLWQLCNNMVPAAVAELRDARKPPATPATKFVPGATVRITRGSNTGEEHMLAFSPEPGMWALGHGCLLGLCKMEEDLEVVG